MSQYIASVDVGTTGARCALIDLSGKIVASEYYEYGAVYLKPGWVEQDADEMIGVAMDVCHATVIKSGVRPEQIAAVGFSTQRSVTVPVYKDGGKVRLALSWQDSRTAAEVADMLKLIDAEEYYQISGMPMGTTWNITKMLWMRKNEPELYKKTHKFVQLQDATLHAFGADEFYTDMGDLAFYGVWDVGKLEWSARLCNLFDVSPEMFGRPTACGTQVAEVSPRVAERTGFAVGTPVCVGAGDQNCAAVGMGAARSGIATASLGTGALVMLSMDRRIPGFGGMMVTNHAAPGMWEMEALSNAAAGAYRWYRDVVGTAEKQAEGANGGSAFDALERAGRGRGARQPGPAVHALPGQRGDPALERQRARRIHRHGLHARPRGDDAGGHGRRGPGSARHAGGVVQGRGGDHQPPPGRWGHAVRAVEPDPGRRLRPAGRDAGDERDRGAGRGDSGRCGRGSFSERGGRCRSDGESEGPCGT